MLALPCILVTCSSILEKKYFVQFHALICYLLLALKPAFGRLLCSSARAMVLRQQCIGDGALAMADGLLLRLRAKI